MIGATDCLVMEDYSADAFVLAFIRFSCKYGYPKQLLPDEGSQLVKGCKGMVISFSSLQHKLNVEYVVNFKVCPVGAHYMHGKGNGVYACLIYSPRFCVTFKRLSILSLLYPSFSRPDTHLPWRLIRRSALPCWLLRWLPRP